jgi:hypothetical protein
MKPIRINENKIDDWLILISNIHGWIEIEKRSAHLVFVYARTLSFSRSLAQFKFKLSLTFLIPNRTHLRHQITKAWMMDA